MSRLVSRHACSSATSQAKYSAWLNAASSLGLRAEVYPLTRYGHLDPLEMLPFGQTLGTYLANGCLAVMLDDEFESIKRTLCPSDVVAPWHLRAAGSQGAPCNYLVVRPEASGDRATNDIGVTSSHDIGAVSTKVAHGALVTARPRVRSEQS